MPAFLLTRFRWPPFPNSILHSSVKIRFLHCSFFQCRRFAHQSFRFFFCLGINHGFFRAKWTYHPSEHSWSPTVRSETCIPYPIVIFVIVASGCSFARQFKCLLSRSMKIFGLPGCGVVSILWSSFQVLQIWKAPAFEIGKCFAISPNDSPFALGSIISTFPSRLAFRLFWSHSTALLQYEGSSAGCHKTQTILRRAKTHRFVTFFTRLNIWMTGI